jgi:hypothetical protein
MNNQEAARMKVDHALNQLMAGVIDWWQLEEVIEEVAKTCGPLPQVKVEITYGGKEFSSSVQISKGGDV